MENFKEKLNKITTFIFDMDGVLTNGKILLMPGQDPARQLNSKDGYAFHLASQKGYKLFLLSGGHSNVVKESLLRIGFRGIYMSQPNKLDCYKDMLIEHDLKSEEIIYMGDDLPDYYVMSEVGIASCPADAAHEIKALSIYVSHLKGGEGCARDIIEQVLRLKGDWSAENW
jgi:3-deoxy-D-manno-octulosonate 8-phosphate phosphatase (KDO 8-P phosphatase)